MPCAARAKGVSVSSARCCRGTMAAVRGEAGGCRDWGLGTPRGAVASERQRWSAPVGGRPSSAPAGLWGPGARPGRRAAGVCVEPLPGLSARRRRSGQCGAASLVLRLPSPRRTPRWTARQPKTAPASTSWQWVGTEFRQARAAADPARGRGAGAGLETHHPAGSRTGLCPGWGHRGCGLRCASCPRMLRGIRACSGCRA